MAERDEEQQRLEEIRRKAEEEEARRIDEEIARRTKELLRTRKKAQDTKREAQAVEAARREAEAEVRQQREREGARKLAAIMFTDIKAFSKKMGKDEAAAMQILRVHDAMIRDAVEKHSGKIIKSIGDSCMVDFSSAVNAVRCAMEVQTELWKYNQGKPEFERMEVRIGIHLDDVITVGNDIFGDGVNIASRIETIAEPQRICISQDIYNQIKNEMPIRVVSIGSIELKNIAEPVEVYEILIDSIPELAEPSETARQVAVRKEEKKRKAEEEARRKREEEEKKSKAEEEARRKREEEERRRKAEEEARRKREEEEKKRKAEEEARRKREEEERRRKAEEEARRKRDEEDKKRKAEEEARRKREEEERKRKAEQEARRKREEEDRKKKAEEEARRKREEEERQKKAEEEARRTEEEKQKRIQTALTSAVALLAKNEFAKAHAEVEPILADDPMHTEALELDRKIREAEVAVETANREAAERAKEIEVIERETEPLRPSPKRSSTKAFIAVGLVVVAAVVIVILALKILPGLFAGKATVAILPFESATNTPDEEQLGLALAQESAILAGLVPSIHVLSPTSSANIKQFVLDPRLRANKLGFRNVLIGSVRMRGSDIELQIHLVDTTGKKIWSENVKHPQENLSTLPGEVVRRMGEALSVSMPEASLEIINRTPTRRTEAYGIYLHGRTLMQSGAPETTARAIELFDQATRLDDRFADAFAAAAFARATYVLDTHSTDETLLRQAEDLANKALSLGSHLPEARNALALVAILRKQYRRALNELENVLRQKPNDSIALWLMGLAYAFTGYDSRAIGALAKSYEVDKANPRILTTFGLTHLRFGRRAEAMAMLEEALSYVSDTTQFLARVAGDAMLAAYQYDRAIRIYERRVASDPNSFVDRYKLARAYQLAGRESRIWTKTFEETIEVIHQELRRNPSNPLAFAYLGLVYSRYGRFPEGEANGRKALELAPNNVIILYRLAQIYSIQKKEEAAIEAVNNAIEARYVLGELVDQDLFHIRTHPLFDAALREHLK